MIGIRSVIGTRQEIQCFLYVGFLVRGLVSGQECGVLVYVFFITLKLLVQVQGTFFYLDETCHLEVEITQTCISSKDH